MREHRKLGQRPRQRLAHGAAAFSGDDDHGRRGPLQPRTHRSAHVGDDGLRGRAPAGEQGVGRLIREFHHDEPALAVANPTADRPREAVPHEFGERCGLLRLRGMVGHHLEQRRERPDRHALPQEALERPLDAGHRQHVGHDLFDERRLRCAK